ncbi:MAG TPA: type II toxin-antitoxin system VapC family toxin [Chloroflexota bacterium]
MRFLLDTHLLLWALNNPERLANATRDAIEDSDNDVLFSTASIWEIANKARLRRTDFAVRAEKIATEAIATEALARGFGELLIRWQSASIVTHLPPHHRDPFDRILLAQAITEPVHLYTVDRKLVPYSALVVLA